MAGSVAGRRDNANASVAEDVVLALEGLAVGVAQAFVECGIEPEDGDFVSEGGVVLRLLDEECRVFDLVRDPDVVEVHVGERHVIERGEIEADIGELLAEGAVETCLQAVRVLPALSVGRCRRKADGG